LHNSAATQALCRIAIGRRNYLFAGADSGGVPAAAIYLLIGMAKLNKVGLRTRLRYVLTQMADHPVNRVDELPIGAPADRASLNNAPLYSEVMPALIKSAHCLRRWWTTLTATQH
jgi:hypothetical protein